MPQSSPRSRCRRCASASRPRASRRRRCRPPSSLPSSGARSPDGGRSPSRSQVRRGRDSVPFFRARRRGVTRLRPWCKSRAFSRRSSADQIMAVLQRISSLVVLAMVWIASPVAAQDYPSRPVKVIMPFGAGGPTDVFTRAVADELSRSLKQPFVMENRPGAGTIIGTDAAAKSPPDGYTLLMMSATQTTTETLVPTKPFKLMRDFVPVASLLSSELVLVVRPSLGVNTVQELIALAKAKRGQLNYASSGVGSNYHMAGELFKNMTGTEIQHVPYRGSAGAR